MDKTELTGYVRLITSFLPIVLIAAYTRPAALWIRRLLIVLFVAGASASVGIPAGWEMGVLAALCFALAPLPLGLISHWLNKCIIRRVEMVYGAGSVGAAAQYEILSIYRLLWGN